MFLNQFMFFFHISRHKKTQNNTLIEIVLQWHDFNIKLQH